MPLGQQVVPLPLPHGSGHRTVRVSTTIWLQAVLPWYLSRVGGDVCHFTNNVGAWWTPCPSIVTIHDATLWLFPGYHPRRSVLAMRPFIPLGARRAQAIIAVSEHTKRDLVRMLKIPAAKVYVVHEAPSPSFHPLPHSAALEQVRGRYGLPRSFVLHVGTLEPRKNLTRLVEAYALLRRSGFRSHDLVLVGSRGGSNGAVLRSVERLGLDGAVHLLGYAPTESLVALYNLADVVAFPTLYEGFGLPVVEAMACGTPVVTSPNGSLAEIAGSAAEVIDPLDVDAIAAGLRRVLSDPQRGAELRRAGLARAAEFSWERAAAETRQLYHELGAHQRTR